MGTTEAPPPVTPLLIEGQAVASIPSVRFDVYSYEQQRVVGQAESANVKMAELACESAARAFKSWKHVSAVQRRAILLRYSALLRSHADELASIQKEETSAPEIWCHKNVQLATGLIEETAACITSLKGEVLQAESSETLALALTMPLGPVLVIAPWNSPIILGARNIATAVAAGCTVVFKTSELCPRLHHRIATLLIEAGLPDGVLNVLQTSRQDAPAVTEAIVAHPAIRKIEFVGSANVGKMIGQIAAKHLKPIFMELGGKGPAIVLDDADLEAAARKCAWGAFLHHGQLCFSTERIIVLESVEKTFQQLLKKETESFHSTNGVSSRIVDASIAKLKEAESKGASYLAGGSDRATETSLQPTILTGVTKDMALYDEEAFGPSAALFVARDDAHAIELANDTAYGLNAAIHTKDLHRALVMAKELVTGQVHVNNMTPHDEPTLPIGGSKESGWGRNNAIYGLREFCETKTITWSPQGNLFV